MTTTAILSEANVATLVNDLVAAGTVVIAPVQVGTDCEHTEYRPIERLDEATLAGAMPRHSLKEFFRPVPGERTPCTPQVVLGARACDAAGVERLDRVMRRDYSDDLWLARRDATTIVTVACSGAERSCFCGAVGLEPDSTRGTDAILVPLDVPAGPAPSKRRIAAHLRQGVELFLLDMQPYAGAAELQTAEDLAAEASPRPKRWAMRAVTAKGEALLAGRGQPVGELDRARLAAFERASRESVAKNLVELRLAREGDRLDPELEAQLAAADGGELIEPVETLRARAAVEKLPEWLSKNFDHELWKPLADKCRGCGTCSAVCSTSPCFELDERDRALARRRSGGVPAPRTQTERFRQRIMHKFSVYPHRFDAILCTGCGRCSRACEAGMRIQDLLGKLVQLAAPVPVRVTT